MRIENRPTLVTDDGDVDSDGSTAIMEMVLQLRHGNIVSKVTPLSSQAALRIVEILLEHPMVTYRIVKNKL